jgi:excisionase family DNA binding protein
VQIEIPDEVVDALRDALGPLIERLIDEKVQQKRPMLLSVNQVAEELTCSKQSVYGLIRGGHLEAIRTGGRYRIASAVLEDYVDELTRPKYQREVVDAHKVRSRRRKPTPLPSAVLSATKPPRHPRPRPPKKASKQEVADSRMTLAELCDIFGESSSELLAMAGIALADDGTFRRGDVLTWIEEDRERYEEWALTHV